MLDSEVYNTLSNPANVSITPGTERMKQILSILGNPQLKYQVIHITGTNGKGSTAAFIETGLAHAGVSVGKYTSPYIKSINETILFNCEPINDNDLNFHFWQIKPYLDKYKILLSPFEFLTVIMFVYFAKKHIDYLVLEVGLGGIDDATNVVDSVVSIITNISLEHTRYLGETLSDIAKAKAGIIKNGYTIIADSQPQLLDAVKARTTKYVNVLDKYSYTTKLDCNRFHTFLQFLPSSSPVNAPEDTYELSLFGRFQAKNFLCAYETLQRLGVQKDSIKYAAENTSHPGRLEVHEHNPLVVLDATHNADGAKNLADSLYGLYKPDEVIIITSILSDKDQQQMLSILSRVANDVICTNIDNNPRSTPAENLAQTAKMFFKHVITISNPSEALLHAKHMNKRLTLITGSLYLLSYFLL